MNASVQRCPLKLSTSKISKFSLFLSCFADHVTILFTLMRWQSIVIAVMTGVRSAICQQQLRLLFVLVLVIAHYNSWHVKVKRSLDDELDVVHSVCPSESAWRALDTALDINNTAVRVYQPAASQDLTFPAGGSKRHVQTPPRQWFYTVTCRNDVMAPLRPCPGCCLAIDHTR